MSSPTRTSLSHPLRIDTLTARPDWGQIGMSLCPGKKQTNALTGAWQRDLHLDLCRIRKWGAEVVLTLIESHEFPILDVEKLPDAVTEFGMKWLHAPIPDRNPPDAKFLQQWPELRTLLIDRLATRQKIFIHCMGGLGRTGVVAAMLLIEAGTAADQAIELVRQSRPHTIETFCQEAFVRNYVRSQTQD